MRGRVAHALAVEAYVLKGFSNRTAFSFLISYHKRRSR